MRVEVVQEPITALGEYPDIPTAFEVAAPEAFTLFADRAHGVIKVALTTDNK